MPEQLTKHPDVTLQVLRSGAARCGEGEAQQILTRCPPERFCKLPGGELCVYGLPEASAMTQLSAADWQSLAPPPEAPTPEASPSFSAYEALSIAGLALFVGLVIGIVAARMMAGRR